MPVLSSGDLVLSSCENSCIRLGFRAANIQQISVTFCRASLCLTYFTYKKQGTLPHLKTTLYKPLTYSWFRKWPSYGSKVAHFCSESGPLTGRKWPSYESLTIEIGFARVKPALKRDIRDVEKTKREPYVLLYLRIGLPLSLIALYVG